MTKVIDTIKALISKGKTDEAIEELLTLLKKGDTKLFNQVAGLSGQYHQQMRDLKLNLSNDTTVLNRIAMTLLEICDEIKDKEELKSSSPQRATKKGNATKIRKKLAMEKRVTKDFINSKFLETIDYKRLINEPYLRFNYYEVLIISIDDETYPNFDESKGKSSRFITYPYYLYHSGMEFCFTAGIGAIAIMNKEGFWEKIDYNDQRRNSKEYTLLNIHIYGRIPYLNIIDYKLDGDEYTDMPMIFCEFNYDGAPYEELVYRTKGEYITWEELDKSMMTKFER